MKTLHDADHRASIEARLRKLSADSQHLWGKMEVDQMLCHVNTALAMAMGEVTFPPDKIPIPKGLLKWIVLHLPWGKNSPTASGLIMTDRYDFNTERSKTFEAITRFKMKSLESEWPVHPAFGVMSGMDSSRVQAKHLDHHLRQFGV